MMGSAIGELAAAAKVPLVCAASDEGTIQIWNLSNQEKIGEIAVRFAFGARNLAVHPGAESLVTGISKANGTILGYRMSSGQLMWQKNRMRYPARIRFAPSGEYLFCTLDNNRVERVDARTGNTTELLQNTVQYIEGPAGHALRIPAADSSYLLRHDEHEVSFPKLTFAVLDVSFGTNSLCITESGGPVRCLDYLSGAERWRYTPPEGSHALTLHYNGRDGFFYGIVWQYEKGNFRHLLRFEGETGQPSHVRDLNSWEEVFSEATQQLVTSSGEIIDLSSGEVAGQLAFPSKEYPDRFALT